MTPAGAYLGDQLKTVPVSEVDGKMLPVIAALIHAQAAETEALI